MATLRFANGMMKGRPLEDAGLPFKIVKMGDEEVAQFRNGARARFTRDPDEEKVVSVLREPPPPPDPEQVAVLAPENYQPPKGLGPDFIMRHRQRRTLGVYHDKNHNRSRIGSDPVYCVLDNGRIEYNVSRDAVGTGLREFLWLYQTYRELHYGRFHAFWEAYHLYML
jgi:hypothetical protein